MVQISRAGLVCSGPVDDVERQRRQFERCHVIRWPGLLDPDLLTLIQRQIDEAEFQEQSHAGIGQELCMAHNVTLSLLHLLTNDPKLFRLVQREAVNTGPGDAILFRIAKPPGTSGDGFRGSGS